MTADLRWFEVAPLRRPLLLMAFEGLFDAAESATSALSWLQERSESELMAEVDSEEFYNFTEARPTVRFSETGDRVIDWPQTEVWACRTDGPRDLVVMKGVEPHLKWRSFGKATLEVAQRSGSEMAITIGAMVSMVPHTRPLAVTGSAADELLANRLHLSLPTYEGPTGVVGVINRELHVSGLPVISLRVAVPHYVPGPPNPKATRALLRKMQQISRVPTGYEEMDPQVTEWVNQVDSAVASDEESAEYVKSLEERVDSDVETLPSGDDLAAELEAFLRETEN